MKKLNVRKAEAIKVPSVIPYWVCSSSGNLYGR